MKYLRQSMWNAITRTSLQFPPLRDRLRAFARSRSVPHPTLLLLTLFFMAGCDRGSSTSSTGGGGGAGGGGAGGGKIRLQLNWVPEPQFGGFYAAEQSGAYKKHGL